MGDSIPLMSVCFLCYSGVVLGSKPRWCQCVFVLLRCCFWARTRLMWVSTWRNTASNVMDFFILSSSRTSTLLMLANTPAGKQVKYRRMHELVSGVSEWANGRASDPVLTSGFFVILDHSEIRTDGGITFWQIHLQVFVIFPVLKIEKYFHIKSSKIKKQNT